jgi:hypothetical protein
VLECLTNDPEPTPEDELRNGDKFDPSSLSINTTRGEAMRAVVEYALWVRRRIQNEPGFSSAEGFNRMPEVRTILDRHLDPGFDPSLAIRAVYGQWFPWLHFLDRQWATESVPRIFARDEALRDLRNAAWTTYIVFCQSYDEVFAVLQEDYRHAIDIIGTAREDNGNLDAPDSRLAQHLVTEYLRGKLNAEDQDGLLTSFYAKADVKLRSSVIDFAGRSLHNTSREIPPQALERFRKLWVSRFEVVRASEAVPKKADELTAFGWWFVSKKFPDQWSIDQLIEVLMITNRIEPEHLVLERLAELSASMPLRTVECLALIVEGDREGWAILGWRGHVRTIIATAISTVDENTRRRAATLVHYLGTRGNFEFRDLLPLDVTG